VRFSVRQPVGQPPETVLGLLVDADFYPKLGELGAISPPIVRRRTVVPDAAGGRGRVELDVEYRFAGTLSGPARAILDPATLSWVDHTVVDLARGQAEFRMEAIHPRFAHIFRSHGTWQVEVDTADPARSALVMEGEVEVGVPIVGPVVERAMVTGLHEHLALMARLLEAEGDPQASAADD
jgi:hypothetical protein